MPSQCLGLAETGQVAALAVVLWGRKPGAELYASGEPRGVIF